MYSIKKVSELLGIPAVTIRAWENRYQIITPNRSHGGHRLYSDSDIQILKWLKTQTEENSMKIGEAVSLLKQGTLDGNSPDALPSHNTRTYDDFAGKLFGELVDLHTAKSHETIDLAFSIFHYEDVFHRILVPVLIRLGDEWEKGNISVAQEHFSSQLITQRILQILRVLPVDPQLPRALALCPEGEHHQIGLLIFTLFLRKKGWDVIYLGPNTPLSRLISLIGMKNISVVAVSVTDPKHVESMENWIRVCRVEFPELKFVLGGEGFKHCTAPISSYVQSSDYESWERWYQSAFPRRSALSFQTDINQKNGADHRS
jgi:MerR family transcriptional regulator, light-induced transcriptional regulator